MVSVWVYTFASVAVISLISLVGVLTLAVRTEQLKKLLIYLVSFAAGGLFGDAFIHLLPEVVEAQGFSLRISLYVLAGIVTFFVLEKVVHWHHYHLPHTKEQVHPFAITNLIGDGFHNFIDGIIVGASYLAGIPVGVATTIAVIFHEIPQEIGDFGVLLEGGFSRGRALLFNFITALLSVVGASAALMAGMVVGNLELFLVPFAAGGFLYVAGADLIPELHKEFSVGKAFGQFGMLLLGMGVMVALTLLE